MREFAVLENKPSTNLRHPFPPNMINVLWHPHIKSFFKINSDGSYLENNKTGGVGLIIRDFAGTHQRSKFIFLDEAINSEQVECKEPWEAMQWAIENNLEIVAFEMDAKLVVDAVQSESLNIDWRIHNLILDIKNLLSISIHNSYTS